MSSELQTSPGYQSLIGRISEAYRDGRLRALQAVNTQLLATNWQIGHDIADFEQGGQTRADSGSALLHHLSRDLTRLHGKGFSRSNLIYMRLLYLEYPISQKPSDLLSWSHYVELLRIEDRLERSFYEQQSIKEKWSVPELQRQKKSSLFLRLAALFVPGSASALGRHQVRPRARHAEVPPTRGRIFPNRPARARGCAPEGGRTPRGTFLHPFPYPRLTAAPQALSYF